MRRVAFALASLIIIGILSAGLLIKPGRTDGRGLLITAAQAMEEAKTVHAIGYVGAAPPTHVGDKIAPNGLSDDTGTYEQWYSADGMRYIRYDQDGRLEQAQCTNVASGVHRMCYPRRKQVAVYRLGTEIARKVVESTRLNLVDGEAEIDEQMQSLGITEITTRRERRNGRDVTIISLPIAKDQLGKVTKAREYALDTATGRQLSVRVLCLDGQVMRILGGYTFDYDLQAPAALFQHHGKPGFAEVESEFRVSEDGGRWLFYVAPPGEKLEPREDTTGAGGAVGN